MFDLGLPELLVIGVVALIVVGPKDLPVLFRTVGRFVGKAKGMAREFSSAMNQAADQAGVKDVTDTLKGATDGLNKVSNPLKAATDAINDSANEVKRSMSYEPGAETTRLSKERAEAAEKIRQKSAEMAQERLDREAAEKAAAEKAAKDAPKKDEA
ncbi:twin-arginine translocase subunit TatB [Shimia sp. R11_0]|uniref:Sec-independent protein translocase protein TatB n=1 Tax=Shimia marina TaxID=321267 RepID=A0A0P1EKC1_9RHOB|nr:MULTISPECIES: Sec-independent protein translocase protein TatB [Shimia]MBO9477785.1 twin-arginine translocase subunit TatB [Shimia sp. R11_0]CUH50632.1 Sec-independent protein translocase protein TatB [Shimia marina]SFE38307.1 sec-independent protein translocase protein TatB [Shimia marina]